MMLFEHRSRTRDKSWRSCGFVRFVFAFSLFISASHFLHCALILPDSGRTTPHLGVKTIRFG